MLSSEYTALHLLRAREQQLQRDVERIRVARERQAQAQAELGGMTSAGAGSTLSRVVRALVARRRSEAQPACQ